MAIVHRQSLNFDFRGDGSTDALRVNLFELNGWSPDLKRPAPDSLVSVSSAGLSIATSNYANGILDVTFDSAPANNTNYTLAITFAWEL